MRYFYLKLSEFTFLDFFFPSDLPGHFGFFFYSSTPCEAIVYLNLLNRYSLSFNPSMCGFRVSDSAFICLCRFTLLVACDFSGFWL